MPPQSGSRPWGLTGQLWQGQVLPLHPRAPPHPGAHRPQELAEGLRVVPHVYSE